MWRFAAAVCIALLAASCTPGQARPSPGQPAAPDAATAIAPRLKLNFNPAWSFIKQDAPDAKEGWSLVSCPHTFNDIDTFDDLSPGSHQGEIQQWQGKTWYRKHFTPDRSWA